MARKLNDQYSAANLRHKLWPAAAGAVEHIIDASRFGYVRKHKPKLTESEILLGVELVPVENSLKYDELIIKNLGLSAEHPDDFMMYLANKGWDDMLEMIMHDGITPAITTVEELKHYMLCGADYSNVPIDDPEIKKKDGNFDSAASI